MKRTLLTASAMACLVVVASSLARAADHVRIGATTTLVNTGIFNDTGVGVWSPGADLRVSVPLACWTSVGASAGYQHVVRDQQFATINVTPRDVGHLWLEWSAYALANSRFEIGGRLALGLAHAFTAELSGGPALALYGTATYWATRWLGATLDLGVSASLFSTTDNSGDGAKPEGLELLSLKAGLMTRF